jgi:hypothetical protein
MTRETGWLRRLVGIVGLSLLTLPAGCMSYLNPVHTLPREQMAFCDDVPKCSRNHVYIFFVHGMDPLDCANLRGLRDYVQSLGFIKTYYGQCYHKTYFVQEICRLHKEDPDARFALVGFSFGANMIRDICHAVEPEGVTIDLLLYLGGNTLQNVPADRPANATQIVNILACGSIWNGDTLDNAINITYPDVYHFGSPTHVRTLTLLAEELTKAACRVPVVETVLPPLEEEAPTPRPVKPEASRYEPDEWDFLKPRNPALEHGLRSYTNGGAQP